MPRPAQSTLSRLIGFGYRLALMIDWSLHSLISELLHSHQRFHRCASFLGQTLLPTPNRYSTSYVFLNLHCSSVKPSSSLPLSKSALTFGFLLPIGLRGFEYSSLQGLFNLHAA